MRRFLSSPIPWMFIWSITSFSGLFLGTAVATSCTHYASPTGTGDGTSAARPFRMVNFWKIAKPGYTLCLMDGKYTGSESMITPPSGLSGAAAAPITIRAINDGGPWINGQRVRNPFVLKNNDYFIVEGIDLSDSNGTTILLDSAADNNIIRRVCAWNAARTTIWMITGAKHNLLEDVCGFGTGNKVFANVGGGNTQLTIRRAWGVWEQGNVIGPKLTFSTAYYTRTATYENLIGTWKESGSGARDQRYGIFGTEKLSQSNQCANTKFLGSIAYIRSDDIAGPAEGMGFFGSRSVDCIHAKDLVINIEGHPGLRPIQAQTFDGLDNKNTTRMDAPFRSRKLENLTKIGGGASIISSHPVNGWNKVNHVDVASVSAANSAGANPFQPSSGNGARVCKRYINGVLTSQPLWPWPMDVRINAALTRAGKNPSAYFRGDGHTVTSEMETQFGRIPGACKGDSSSHDIRIPAPPTRLELRP